MHTEYFASEGTLDWETSHRKHKAQLPLEFTSGVTDWTRQTSTRSYQEVRGAYHSVGALVHLTAYWLLATALGDDRQSQTIIGHCRNGGKGAGVVFSLRTLVSAD